MSAATQTSWRETLAAQHDRARADGRTRWLALRGRCDGADPLAIFDAAAGVDGFFWQAPNEEFALAGVGVAHSIEATGGGRFAAAAAAGRELFADLEVCELGSWIKPLDARRTPFLVGGFGFYEEEPDAASPWRDFGAGWLFLPEILVVATAQGTELMTCHAVPADVELETIEREVLERLEDADAMTRITPQRAASGRPSHEAVVGHPDALGEVLHDDSLGPEYRVRSDRAHARYCATVDAALEDIGAGKLSKVVLGRSLEVVHDGAFALSNFLGSLRSVYPSCVTLAVRRGEGCFVSATPERLVRLADGDVSTAAVAGSAARGRSPEEEERLGRFLMESPKERAEHDLVRRAIVESLDDVCGELSAPDAPRLLRLEGIQHLETPLHGTLLPEQRDRVGVLELVARLHPTPAVAGAPASVAVDWLRQHEELDRGWYTGPVGYVDARGEGEFRVALRSGLIRAGAARLYAGAGIVDGSQSEQELAETRLKLRALLAPLTEI